MKEKAIPSPYQKEDVITEEGYGRFSKSEVILLRVFKDAHLVRLLKKVFFQMEFSEDEKLSLGAFFKDNIPLCDAVTKIFAPHGDDIVLSGGTRWSDRRYADMILSEVKPVVLARRDSIRFIARGIERLGKITTKGDFSPLELVIDVTMSDDYEDLPPEQVKRKVVAFQDSMTYLEVQITGLLGIISKKEETPEERETRLKKDSTR